MRNARLIFEKQWIHLLALVILLTGMALVAENEYVRSGYLWNISTPVWFWMAAGLAITQQVYVWLCWRIQLQTSWFTNALGKRSGFNLYAAGFVAAGSARITVACLLAISNRETISMNALALKILGIAILIPLLYTIYAIHQHFGFQRAFGIDHFDESYRNKPLVRRGIFKLTRNAMYTFGMLLLWFPAFWWASLAALIVAFFNHLYIWVHYYATELPDMKRIYGEAQLMDGNDPG